MEKEKEINWEQRRYETARQMLGTIYACDRCDSENEEDYLTLGQAAGEAVRYADALIARLREEGGRP